MVEPEKELFDRLERQWSDLTIANDFVFGKVMLDEGLCHEVLEAILGVPIERVEYVGRQEVLDASPESKGIRLDVYVRDAAGTVYNVEMQSVDTGELPRRSRYYQALMTLDQLDRGERYSLLKDSYVIFVCNFDLFGKGRRVYSFENRCLEDGTIALGDGARTMFLSATAPAATDGDARINEFLDYVAHRRVTGNLSAKLDAAVARVLDNSKWRLQYMMLQVRDQLNIDKGFKEGLDTGFKEGFEQGCAEGREEGLAEGRQEGLAEGREEGLAEGLAEGRAEGRQEGLAEGREEGLAKGRAEGLKQAEDKIVRLMQRIIADGLTDELNEALADRSKLAALYERYGIA